jgi:hypothetical protein
MFAMVFFLCCSASSFADALKDENEVQELGDFVLETVVSAGIVSAFDAMKPFVQLDEADMDTLASESKGQRDQFAARFGKSTGYELIGIEKVGTSLLRLQYIEKTEKHAFPWSFYFYKTDQGWMLNDFTWHGDIRRVFSGQASIWPE